ncbi:MAG: hypothetical protein U9N57_08710 [Pseudomonadota bacterium]|nr:hypothetical protein [Pseudomonadota bacterium]
MKRLFIGSTLILSATIFLTGCVSHAPVKSVHIVKAHPNHYNSYYVKKPAYKTHSTVKVYQIHHPKAVRYEPQRTQHNVHKQPVYKHRDGYVKTHKSIKPYSKDSNHKQAYSKKKIVTNKRTVKVVKKSRPIVVNKPKKQGHQSRKSDNRNQKTYKNDRKESHKKDDSRSEQKSEHRNADTRKVKKVRSIQTDRTYSHR